MIEDSIKSSIQTGLLVLLAIEEGDGPEDIEWLSGKIVRLRVFADDNGVMNRSVQEVGGGILLISQFTLYADTAKGRRPSWNAAAPGTVAEPLVATFAETLRELGASVESGVFGANMQVELINDGPVTVILEL